MTAATTPSHAPRKPTNKDLHDDFPNLPEPDGDVGGGTGLVRSLSGPAGMNNSPAAVWLSRAVARELEEEQQQNMPPAMGSDTGAGSSPGRSNSQPGNCGTDDDASPAPAAAPDSGLGGLAFEFASAASRTAPCAVTADMHPPCV